MIQRRTGVHPVYREPRLTGTIPAPPSCRSQNNECLAVVRRRDLRINDQFRARRRVRMTRTGVRHHGEHARPSCRILSRVHGEGATGDPSGRRQPKFTAAATRGGRRRGRITGRVTVGGLGERGAGCGARDSFGGVGWGSRAQEPGRGRGRAIGGGGDGHGRGWRGVSLGVRSGVSSSRGSSDLSLRACEYCGWRVVLISMVGGVDLRVVGLCGGDMGGSVFGVRVSAGGFRYITDGWRERRLSETIRTASATGI
jgi:hypothetical protein